MDALFLYDFQRERGWKAKKGIVYGFFEGIESGITSSSWQVHPSSSPGRARGYPDVSP